MLPLTPELNPQPFPKVPRSGGSVQESSGRLGRSKQKSLHQRAGSSGTKVWCQLEPKKQSEAKAVGSQSPMRSRFQKLARQPESGRGGCSQKNYSVVKVTGCSQRCKREFQSSWRRQPERKGLSCGDRKDRSVQVALSRRLHSEKRD